MKWTFLVVDDNETELRGTTAQLARVYPGAEMLTASSGSAALTLLEERRIIPSLMLVDFAMPGMNAVEFLSELKMRRWLERAPVIVVSEPIADRHIVTCYRMGAASFLAKPVHQFELRQAIREFARPAQQMAAASMVPALPNVRTSAA